MDCATFETLLFASLDSNPGPAERQSMSRHLETCERCRRLSMLVGGLPDPDTTSGADDDLTMAILARTSGKPCEQAAALLADMAEDAARSDPLLSQHVATCADCAAIERTLTHMGRDLPALAEADPGPDFVSSVLTATSGSIEPLTDPQAATAPPFPRRARASRPATARSPKPGLWQRLARRPRIALEGSYLVAMLIMLVVGVPTASDGNAIRSLDAWWRERAEATREFMERANETARTGQEGLSDWSASAASALDSSAQVFWDSVLAPRSDTLRRLWNESADGDVESGAMD